MSTKRDDLRVWGLWDRLAETLLFVNSDYSAVLRFRRSLGGNRNIHPYEILRFDLSPLYKTEGVSKNKKRKGR